MTGFSDAKILIIATDGFQQHELEVPLETLKKAGATVVLAAPKGGSIRGWEKGNWGGSVPVDRTLGEVSEEDFDALVIPGGVMNPDRLRTEKKAVDLVKAFADKGKVVAAICHGPWLLVEADILDGREVTSWPSLKTDLENAGGIWEDREVINDDGVITSRKPDDLPAFCNAIIEAVTAQVQERAA